MVEIAIGVPCTVSRAMDRGAIGHPFIESMDGTRMEQGPGEIISGGDQRSQRNDRDAGPPLGDVAGGAPLSDELCRVTSNR
jgi:hypothetical protein